MYEEDEIDVLGEFNLDNYLCKSDSNVYRSLSLVSEDIELLNCDYTIHPQWLLDKPSTNPDNWYDTNSSTSSYEKAPTETDSPGHVSTENSITDESGWTEKEKGLFERGIEIFGRSNVRLSQFIGSKTPAQVRYYIKNFYLDSPNPYENCNELTFYGTTDILNDTQIPASIEEVIEAVSTAKGTVEMHKKGRRKKSLSSSSSEEPFTRIPSTSLLSKSSYTQNCNANIIHNLNKMQSVAFGLKAKNFVSKDNQNLETKKIANLQSRKIEIKNAEITTGEGLAVQICPGEEIIKIKKVDESDSDIEVDIEESDEELKISKADSSVSILSTVNAIKSDQEDIKKIEINSFDTNQLVDLSTVSESTLNELKSLEIPKSEVIVDKTNITELEKVIHFDFFEGRPAKTPVRYMKIRNHIINTWVYQKPTYVTKTSIRQGLKNCGDVNCIGKIHYFLEQIGAINFGCAQMKYIRPLYDMIQQFPIVKDKPIKGVPNHVSILGGRPRYKRKFNNDGEGGYTLTHDEEGHVINTTVVNEEPKQKLYIKKPSVPLIYCHPFTDHNLQPYSIKICLATLLKMDFHAHTSITEVMGLVGGHWIPNEKVLIISHYEPCLNIASSATHCDMCPISQAKAAEIIHNKYLSILGWFHSHPTFAPEPSHQDIETQLVLQRWIGHNQPCIGVILNPFNLSGALIASPFRVMTVDKKVNFEDQMVPYKFKVDLVSDDFTVEEFFRDIKGMLNKNFITGKEGKVNLKKPYFQSPNITYLEKYISSLRMHLAKCVKLPKKICDDIIYGISNI